MLSAFTSALRKFDKDRIFTTTFWSLAIRVSGLGMTLLTTLILTNLLSVANYGVYTYILSTVNLLVLIVVMGSDTLLIRQTTVFLKERNYPRFRGIQVFALCLSAIMLLITILILAVFHPILSEKINAEYFALEDLFLFLLPLLTIIKLLQGFTRGLHAPIAAQLPDQFIRRVVFLILVGVLFFTNKMASTAYNAMLIQVIATVVALISALFICQEFYPKNNQSTSSEFETTKWFKSSFTLAGTTILQTIVSQIPIVFLGFLATSVAVAQYSVVMRTGSLLNFFIIAANMAIAGHIANYYQSENLDKLRIIATRSARLAFLVAAPLGAIVFYYAELLLSVFGDEYIESKGLLRIVIVGYLIHIASGPAVIFLQMTYKEKFTLYVSLAMFIFNILLSYLLILHFSEAGAVFAFMSSFLLYKFIIVRIVWKKVGIDCSILGMRKE